MIKLPVRIIASVLSVCLVAGASLAFTVNSSDNAVIVDADTADSTAANTQEVTQSTQEETATAEVREASWLSTSATAATTTAATTTKKAVTTTMTTAEKAKAKAEDPQSAKKNTGGTATLKTEKEFTYDVQSYSATGTVTANTLNVRTGPGTSYSVSTQLSKGASVTITGSSGTWYQVKFTKGSKEYKDVFVSQDYIKVNSASETPSNPPPNGWYTDSSGNKYLYQNGKKMTGLQTSGELKYYFNSSGVLQTEIGIDVSYHNGNINWTTVKESGIEFVIMRIGYRGYETGKIAPDDKFESYIKGAMAAGLKVGVYFYSQAITEEEGMKEAEYCIDTLQAMGVKASQLAYPVVLDIESNKRNQSNTSATNTAICKAFCSTIKDAGYKPMVYANKDWLTNHINTSQFDGTYPIWLAHYTSGGFSDYTRNYSIWQYTSEGTASKYGVGSQYVDLDLSFYPKNKS